MVKLSEACCSSAREEVYLVPKAGLEPARLAPHAPQTCVSAISPLRQPNPERRSVHELIVGPYDSMVQWINGPQKQASRTTGRGSCIIGVGQKPCQSTEAPVELGGSCSPGPPTLCKITPVSLRRSMMMLTDGHKGLSPHCSTSTTRFCRERQARFDSSGFSGGVGW